MKVVATATAIIALLAGAVQAQTMPPLPQAIQDAGVLRFGVKCDSPPFGFTGPDGQPVGVEVAMAKAIATYAFGSPDKAELTCVTSDARIPSLNGGKIDLILATLGKNPEREKVIDFSDHYFWGTSNIVVLKDSPIQKLADLEGKTLLINKGGSQIRWFTANMPAVNIMQLNTMADSVQALLQGRADAYAGDGGPLAVLGSNNPELRVVEEGYDLGTSHIGVAKNAPELMAFVNAALKRLDDENFYPAAVNEYVEDPAVQGLMHKAFETQPPAAN
ncbi:MAG: transporter substrate-binding domain-containing protein [Devosia sp.]